MKSEALIPQNASSFKEWDAFRRKRWETIAHKVQEWWETIIPVYLQKTSESIQKLLNLSTLGRTVTIRMPWHVSSILPFLHVIQGGVSWWTDPNRAVLNKPSGFLVCATGEEGGKSLFEKQTVVPSNLPLWGFQWTWVQTVGRSALEAQPHNPVYVNVKTNNVTARLICLYFNHLVLEKLS